MFEQPRPSLNIRAVIRDMINEEHELLTALGQDFLITRVDEAETKLNRWQRYLENHYSDGDLLPRGDAGKLPARAKTSPSPGTTPDEQTRSHKRLDQDSAF